MASAKRLGHLLLEQQEPFALEVYLLERGYSKIQSNSTTKPGNGFDTPLKFLKKAHYNINRRKKVTTSCSELARAVFNISLIKTGRNGREMAAEERMSSDSSHNSSSESETSSPQQKQQISKQVDTDKKLQREWAENKQQLSPISVLNETFSDQYSTIYGDNAKKQRVIKKSIICNMDTTMKKENENIFSVTFSKLLEQSSAEKPNFSADYIKIKLALRETKQLLFDCVKEIIDTYRWKKGKQQQQAHVKEFLGAEEIGKILHDNVIKWSEQTIYGTNTRQLLNLDLLASFEESDNLQQQRNDIGVVIGDFISEDLIFEIVADMVSPHPQPGPTKVRRETMR